MQLTENTKTMNFGGFALPIYEGRNKFKPLIGIQLDPVQQCLLDNLWTSQNHPAKRLSALNSLSIYFSKIQNKPLSKSFSFYVVAKGTKPGIYHDWVEVEPLVKYFTLPQFKGFYDFESASTYARRQIGTSYFISQIAKDYLDTLSKMRSTIFATSGVPVSQIIGSSSTGSSSSNPQIDSQNPL